MNELRLGLIEAHPDSIYQHFWGRLLLPRFDEPEYNNDFAAWVLDSLKEKELAERLSVLSPTRYNNIEELRDEMVEIIEQRIDNSEYPLWARADQQFYFIRAQVIIFDTNLRISTPDEFGAVMEKMTPSSIYYHFIDARRRNPDHLDDFSLWLKHFNSKYHDLRQSIIAFDPYFSSLKKLKQCLIELVTGKEDTLK